MSELLLKICSDENIIDACNFLLKKKDSCGTDGMFLSELPDYLVHNKPIFVNSILDGKSRRLTSCCDECSRISMRF